MIGSLVMAMRQGIGAHLTNDEKRAHLTDLNANTSLIRSVFKRFCHLNRVDTPNAAAYCNFHLKYHRPYH